MAVVKNTVQARIMATKRPRPLAVVGPDLDADLLEKLTPGDKLLMEVNGTRYWSGAACPLVAEFPWEVVENVHSSGTNDGQLVLKHPRVRKPFILNYSKLLKVNKGPAVFCEQSLPDMTIKGPFFVILQMVAFGLTENKVSEMFPNRLSMDAFKALLVDLPVKKSLLLEWQKTLKTFSSDGWSYNSIKRFAIRSRVDIDQVRTMCFGSLEEMMALPDDVLCKMRVESHWLPHFLRQSGLIQHDPDAIAAPAEE